MINKKNTGSFYTPSYLANFITNKAISYFESTEISILEPSVGDGAFIQEINKLDQHEIYITALDINEVELIKAASKWNRNNAIFEKVDFLEYETESKYSLIIGNPPYFKKNKLNHKQIDLCKVIHNREGLSEISVKNIWATFLIKSISMLTDEGVLAFVLPSELLQVKFAKEIRDFLKKKFDRIEIFTFDNLMFECKGQDTIILFAFKKHPEKGEYFSNIKSKEDLNKNSFILKNNNLLVDSDIKWTHHFLSTDELNFLEKLKVQLKTINELCESKPGIVTAANKFFIIDKDTEEKYNLSNYTKPIIQKGSLVNGKIVFNDDDFTNLEKTKFPTKLLQINEKDFISEGLNNYLKLGIKLMIPERYKCSIRTKWYIIPNISTKPDAFIFKRIHHYPKLLKNNSSAYVTDSAYKIHMRNDYDINSLIYSFYNSLTLIFSEIEGRYYGGGVLELTPSEFKKLPIPYVCINKIEFETFNHQFKNKNDIEEILNANDNKILYSVLGLSTQEIDTLKIIRKKLIKKRMKLN